MGRKKYYYWYPKTDLLWWSYNSPEEEPTYSFKDFFVLTISQNRARYLRKQLGLLRIPKGRGDKKFKKMLNQKRKSK